MAWNIAVVVDPAYNQDALDQLVRYSPIWIVDTPYNRESADVARLAAGDIWAPEAACTTFRVNDPADRELNCVAILDMLALHHAHLSKLNLIGVKSSPALQSAMNELGFIPAAAAAEDSVAFRRPIANIEGVPLLELDGSNWKSIDDVYNSLFATLGSPAWHGRNFDALNDSIVTGGINAVEVPYRLLIGGLRAAPPEVRDFVSQLSTFISDREAQGCPISVRISS